MADRSSVLDIDALDVHYGPVQVLNGVSLQVAGQGITAIIGPNGAGKSTVLKGVMGYAPPSRGRVRFNGVDITGRPTHLIIADGLGYVPQGRVVFPSMSVREHLDLGAFTRRSDAAFVRASFERVYALFPRLAERKGQAAGTMSGGEQQMLSLARALMARPDLVLLDEPSLGLAPVFVDLVFDTLVRLKEAGIAFLIVEQNATRALEVADYAYVLELGENRLEGTGQELLASESVGRLYLGLGV